MRKKVSDQKKQAFARFFYMVFLDILDIDIFLRNLNKRYIIKYYV